MTGSSPGGDATVGGVRASKADLKRRELVEKAAELFDSVGYHTASVEDVANAAGIRKPTLYHYFKSKEEILAWIHEELIDGLLAREAERANVSLTASQRLLEIIADVLEVMHSQRAHVRVFFEHYRELNPERRATIKKKRDAYEQSIRSIIEQGVADGEFREINVDLTTLALAGMCNWAYQWYQPDGALGSREIAYVFWDILMRGIRP